MDLTTRLVRGAKAFFGARVVYALANAVLLFALTRYLLEPGAYGLLYFAISVVSVGAMLATLGLPKSTGRYVTEFLATDEGQVPHVLWISVRYLTILAFVVAGGMVLLHRPLSRLLDDPTLTPFLLLGAVFVIARSFFSYLTNVFQGFNRVEYTAAISVVNSLTRVVGAIGLVLLGFGALGAFAGYVAGYAAGAVVGLVALRTHFLADLDAATEPAAGLTRRILEYSVPTAATRLSVVLDSRIDKVLLGVLVGPVAVGFYTLAKQIADFCIVPATALGFTISPALGDQHADDHTGTAATLYERSMENVLLLYVPAAVGLALVADPAIRFVVGTDYLGAVPVLQLFSLFVVVRAVHKITGNGLDYLGLARIRALARGTAAGSNVVLNLLLIPPYGVMGAAVATVTTYSAYTAVNVFYIHRELDLGMGYLAEHTLRIGVIALAMGGVVWLARPGISGILSLAAVVLLGATVWSVLSVASGLLDPGEVRGLLA
jgi:O-antigen/teichoic acid export membrane protein